MKQSLAILLTAISLAGCVVTGKTAGGLSIIKPSAAQIRSSATAIVCDSFGPITFSGKNDTPETVRQVRSHNAAWASYGCK